MASCLPQPQPLPGRIQRLEEAVVNRIAAGEVKEMKIQLEVLPILLELSLFAGDPATSQCHKRDGGKQVRLHSL